MLENSLSPVSSCISQRKNNWDYGRYWDLLKMSCAKHNEKTENKSIGFLCNGHCANPVKALLFTCRLIILYWNRFLSV